MVVVGDDRQAIYGFRGADSRSIDRLKAELEADELGLTTTYRCPKAVVALAQRLVPDFAAADSAPDGSVSTVPRERMLQMAEPGDFILSRKNAPLAGICLRLLRDGRKARIQGKDIGKGLIRLIKVTLKPKSIPHFLEKLSRWEQKETERARKTDGNDARAQFVADSAETLRAIAEDLAGVPELLARVENLFADNGDLKGSIICSSIHKAKGLETARVFVLRDTLYPGKDPAAARDKIEEQNLEYVAITRAQRELVWSASR